MKSSLRTARAACAVLLGAVAGSGTVRSEGAEPASLDVVEVTTSNDIISGTDDLYTAELGLTASVRSQRWHLGERMFTDRDLGVRHDETYVELLINLGQSLGIDFGGSVGVIRVGEGILGEGLQNAMHRLVGGDEMALAYPDDDRWYPSLQASATWRALRRLPALTSLRAELFASPGFRSWLRLSAEGEILRRSELQIRAGIGAMFNRVEAEVLRDRVREVLPAWEISVTWRRLGMRVAANSFGTEQRHVVFEYRLRPGRRDKPPG